MTAYADFLASKLPRPVTSGVEPGPVHPSLFGFQEAIVRWAVRRGRAAVFADTGLGKTRVQVEWLRQTTARRGGPGLILAPLAVAEQTIAEAATLGVELRFADAQPPESDEGLWVTNYEKLHRFDPQRWLAVVLDESSILKAITGKTRERLVQDWTVVPYRLACTATPAPNDLEELANHAEFLGVMTRRDMLASYFVHDDDGWRLKGHARDAFFRWMATWAVYLRRPSDLGFGDEDFRLPELRIHDHQVPVEWQPDTELFPALMPGVQGRRVARRQSLDGRVARAVEIVSSRPGQWLVWCGLNAEQDAVAAALGGECVSIAGATPEADRLERERAWRRGEVRVLVTKPSIFGWGLNWQHCHQMVFLGLSDSFEEYYQAIRRCWRFGQACPVDVEIVVSEVEGKVAENVWRKEHEHEQTAAEVIACMADAERAEVAGAAALEVESEPRADAVDGSWHLRLGDACERLPELETASVGLSVHSPPFAQLYTYSASIRDLGNCRTYEEFFAHYRFAVRELLRVTMPGRRACVHVQQIAMTKVMQGIIAWRDFRAEVVRLYSEEGWIYHGEIVIDKDPQAQAIRTKSKTLLFVQLHKDSSWSIPAMADYILLFRAPGENPVPIVPDVTNEEWIRWARPVWYGIRETDTLQAAAARAERDEKHIAPLQLDTVRRCVRLWSNAGEVVLDPMAGIGTVPYVAIKEGRRGFGIELKPEYYAQACRNLRGATDQLPLLATVADEAAHA